ncbi:MAG: hypothetical protein SFX72_06690 [Isosphaeraceae bacterium]|nr:hypothetical protein [Isosphaeraceae bacterium]
MATHSEAILSEEISANMVGCARDAAALLDVSLEADPRAIVERIDAFVFDWQCGKRPPREVIDPEDAPFVLGSLWGEQLVRRFGWEWRMVTFHDHDDTVAPGVLSPDRALAVYPIHFLIGCLADSSVDATILLSFNILAAGEIGVLPRGGYCNLMDGVQRIVPRIATTPKNPWWRRIIG